MDNIPVLNELTMWTSVNEVYASGSTSTIEYTEINYYHSPFLGWLLLTVCCLFIAERIVLELIIRMRK